uniref:IclR family transcriptional regulator domain-containing protein n=1 Tax=Crossiella equi TaxID=130796 RepID=UPI00130226B8
MSENGPFERGLAVLRALAEAPGHRARRVDLVRATSLARSPVDRLVATLLHLGHLREEGPDLLPTPQLLTLGNAYLAGTGLLPTLRPVLARLSAELDESVSFAVPDGHGARLIAQSERRRAMYLVFQVGGVLPVDRSSAGVVLALDWGEDQLADWAEARERDPLDRGFPAVPPLAEAPPDRLGKLRRRISAAREQGWSVDEEWVEPGLLAVSVPVRHDGRLIGALNVLSHTSRHDAASLVATVLPALRRAAGEIRPCSGDGPTNQADPRSGGLAAAEVGNAKGELGMEFVEAFARGLAVLCSFRAGGHTVSSAAAATGLSRATARRALLTLCETGYATESGGHFTLLPTVLDLGYARLSTTTLTDVLLPHLRALEARVTTPVAAFEVSDQEFRCAAAPGRYRRRRRTGTP